MVNVNLQISSLNHRPSKKAYDWIVPLVRNVTFVTWKVYFEPLCLYLEIFRYLLWKLPFTSFLFRRLCRIYIRYNRQHRSSLTVIHLLLKEFPRLMPSGINVIFEVIAMKYHATDTLKLRVRDKHSWTECQVHTGATRWSLFTLVAKWRKEVQSSS